MTIPFDPLDAVDLGVATRTAARPLRREPGESYVIRPHPSPAMERALQRIETETPLTLRRVLGARE